jgi:hypothetical protein
MSGDAIVLINDIDLAKVDAKMSLKKHLQNGIIY